MLKGVWSLAELKRGENEGDLNGDRAFFHYI